MDWFFSETLAPLDRVVRRAQLAKLLRFYVDRARRHRLSDRAYARLTNEIDQLVLKDGYQPGSVSDPDVGYIFCPEHRTGQAERVYPQAADTALWLFGPTLMPDEEGIGTGRPMLPLTLGEPADPADPAHNYPAMPSAFARHDTLERGDRSPREEAATALTLQSPSSPAPGIAEGGSTAAAADDAPAPPQSDTGPVYDPGILSAASAGPADTEATIALSASQETPSGGSTTVQNDPVEIALGETLTRVPVNWPVSIRTNPHLMMVGLPGMGKTTALINIAKQLTAAGIAPVIFSYHDDIDDKIAEAIGPIRTIDFDGLGFNPLRVDSPAPMAYIDVAGTLRDIFASIFPDLGEIQLEELRGAIKQSYDDLGWNDRTRERPQPPQFRTFLDILKSRPKPNQNLLARLQELVDYGFFDGDQDEGGILSDPRPTLVRVHLSTNDIVQRAFAAFVLYSVYKDMFRRGVQTRLTHAIIFDEAHRAAKLKLIPRFAKECRKYGLALALASQGVRDFDGALFEAVASYLVLRVTEADARVLARTTGPTADQQRTTDRLKSLEPYHAMFFSAATAKPLMLRLAID
jgi:hypothetical protein